MVESGANELSEEKMLDALVFGHDSFKPVIDLINELKKKFQLKNMNFQLLKTHSSFLRI